MPKPSPGRPRLIWVVDIEKYGGRTHTAQLDAQARLDWALDQTLRLAGVKASRCDFQDRGDGRLIILPDGIDLPTVAPVLVSGMRDTLYEANRELPDDARIRLRTALDLGVVHDGPTGFVGQAIVRACYLLDCADARKALDEARGLDMMLIVSDELHRDVFIQGYAGTSEDGFRKVELSRPEKSGFAAVGWIHVPGRGFTDPRVPRYGAPPARRGATLLTGAAMGAEATVLAGTIYERWEDAADSDDEDDDVLSMPSDAGSPHPDHSGTDGHHSADHGVYEDLYDDASDLYGDDGLDDDLTV